MNQLRFLGWLLSGFVGSALRRLVRGPLRPGWSLPFEAVTRAIKTQSNYVQSLPPPARRAFSAAMVQDSPLFEACDFKATSVADVEGEWMVPHGVPPDAPVLLYFHGGAYIQGSPDTHRETVVRLARAAQMRAFVPAYRLAPEHPFPAQLEDALAVVRELCAHAVDPSRLVLAGDSAGGNLVLAVLGALREARERLPSAGVLLSPWVDASARGGSLERNATFDWAEPGHFVDWAKTWLGTMDEKDPRASPSFASMAGLPPLFVSVGSAEMLEDQVLAFVEKARGAGVDVSLHHAPDMVHDWFLLAGVFPRCGEVLEVAGQFARQRVAR